MQELREVLAARGLLMSGCWVTGDLTGNCLGCVRMFSPNVVTFMKQPCDVYSPRSFRSCPVLSRGAMKWW